MAVVWAIVVAGGSGERFGGPKQWMPLGGRRVVDWSVDAARKAAAGVVLVLPVSDLGRGDLPDVEAVVAGGGSRSASVRAGLAAVPNAAEVIVVHDAVRPLAGGDLFTAAVEAVLGGAAGAVCAVPMTDTLKRVDGMHVVETVSREGLWAVQTPQAFRADVLRAVHADEPDATDDAGLVEAIGEWVVVVAGDRRNLKITDPVDLAVAEALVR
jgi:2-C-methyl-D-erythritol 4-phosphate cytidylyltransferase